MLRHPGTWGRRKYAFYRLREEAFADMQFDVYPYACVLTGCVEWPRHCHMSLIHAVESPVSDIVAVMAAFLARIRYVSCTV